MSKKQEFSPNKKRTNQIMMVGLLIFFGFAGYVFISETINQKTGSSTSDKMMAYTAVQVKVEKLMKNPGSADWPGILEQAADVTYTNNNTFKIDSWVDGEKSLGVTIRTHFTATVRKVKDEVFIIESLNLSHSRPFNFKP